MPPRKTVSHPVRLVREAISTRYYISQERLAGIVGSSKAAIQLIEAGKLKLSESMASRIDTRLGSSLTKWLRAGADPNSFELDVAKLIRNFELIRSASYLAELPNSKTAETYSFKECEALRLLFIKATKKSVYQQLSWDFIDWLEKQNIKLGLELEPNWHGLDSDIFEPMLNILNEMNDEELVKLGIRKKSDVDKHLSFDRLEEKYDGIDSN